MANLKEMATRESRLTGGHRLCSGCGAPVVVKQILAGTKKPVVVGAATGCLEVGTTIYPYTAWKTPFIHSAFENSAATMSGVETAYRAMKKKGAIEEDVKFVVFAGDGGSYDIGFQSLSGAMERGHNLVYVVYDNEAYMNTGVQRSSSTPLGAATTTSPAGKKMAAKSRPKKDLTSIMVAHNIPYVAQVSPSHWSDTVRKAEKAFEQDGPAFINAMSPCPLGWPHEADQTIELAKLAVDTCYWPLFEVENGQWRLTYKPKKKRPLTDWLELQGRFKHLFKPENKHIIDQLQASVDQKWEALLDKTGRK